MSDPSQTTEYSEMRRFWARSAGADAAGAAATGFAAGRAVPPPVPPAPPVSGATSSGAASSGATSSGAASSGAASLLLRRRLPPERSRRGAGGFRAVFEAVGRAASWKEASAEATSACAVESASSSPRSEARARRSRPGRAPRPLREFVVAGGFVGRAERLQPVDHAAVEVGRLRDLVGASASLATTVPTAALTSAQIASPWAISSSLLSVGVVSSVVTGAAAVVSSPPRRRSRRAPARRPRKPRSVGFGVSSKWRR